MYVVHRERCAGCMLFTERCAVCMLFTERGVQCVSLLHSKVMNLFVSAGGHHGSQRLPGRSSHHEGDEASQSCAVVR